MNWSDVRGRASGFFRKDQSSVDAERKGTTKRTSASRFFGYDIFLSFALGPPPRGTHGYTSDLARRLQARDFTVFFSEEEMAPGTELSPGLQAALSRSKALVVVANRGTLHEPRWVRTEVELFRRRIPARPVIVINVGGALEDPALADGAQEWLDFRGKVWLDESEDAVTSGIASNALVDRLALAPAATRANVKWRRTAWSFLATLLSLTVALAILSAVAIRNAEEAKRQSRVALARQLTAEAELTRTTQRERLSRSALLAIEAHQVDPLSGAEQALRQAVELLPRRIAQIEFKEATRVIFSADDRYMAAVGRGGMSGVWEVSTGRVISKTHGAEALTFVGLDAASNLLVTATRSNRVRVAGIATGEVIADRAFRGRVLDLSDDGQYLAEEMAGDATESRIAIRNVLNGTEEFIIRGARRRVTYVCLGTACYEDVKVRFSRNSRFVTAADREVASVWDVATGKRLVARTHRGEVSPALSADGRYLATLDEDGQRVVVWETRTGRRIRSQPFDERVTFLRFIADSTTVMVGAGNLQFRALPLHRKESGASVSLPHDALGVVAMSPDGRQIISVDYRVQSSGRGRVVAVWETATGREAFRITHEADPLLRSDQRNQLGVSGVTLSNGGKSLASYTPEGISIWDLARSVDAARLGHAEPVAVMAGSPDGRYLATASESRFPRQTYIQVWDTASGRRLWRVSCGAGVTRLVFSPDSRSLAASTDWRARDGPTARAPIQAEPDSDTVFVWDVASGAEKSRIRHKDRIREIAISADGRYVAAGTGFFASLGKDANAEAVVSDSRSGRLISQREQRGLVYAVAFSPDGRWVASGSRDGTVRVWDPGTGSEVAHLSHAGPVTSVAFGPYGGRLASSSTDGTLRLWDTRTWRESRTISHGGDVAQTGWSPDAQRVFLFSTGVLVGRDPRTHAAETSVFVWDASTGRELYRLRHEGSVAQTVFAPDGDRIATASYDGTVRLWNAKTGAELSRSSHGAPVLGVSFVGPNHRYVAAAVDGESEVVMWIWRPEDLLALSCMRLTRNLDWDEWRQHFGDLPYRRTCENQPVHTSVVGAARAAARRGDTRSAAALFRRIIAEAPDLPIDPEREIQREAKRGRAEAALEGGTAFARKGEIRAAVSKFAEAQRVDNTFTIDFASWSLLCWRGSLSGSAGDVVDACENAVGAAPREEAFKAYVGRGLARAMTGKTDGAVQDFRAYVQWERENERELGVGQVVTDWAKALETGVNPFDGPTIEALRDFID